MRLRAVATLVVLVALPAPLLADPAFAPSGREVPADNAWDRYLAAFELVRNENPTPADVWQRVESVSGKPRRMDVRALLATAQPALAKLREGLGKPCVVPRERCPEEYGWGFGEAPQARALARRLRWEGWLHAQHGEHSAAFGSYLDAIAFSQDVARQGSFIARMVCIACEAIACSGIRETVGLAATDEPALAQLVSRLQAVEAREMPYAETLAHEYEINRESVTCPNQLRSMTREEFAEEYGTRAMGAALIRARLDLQQICREAIDRTQRSTWEWDFGSIPRPAEDSLAGELAWASTLAAERPVLRGLANLRGTLLVAALELHHGRTGAYPQRIEELAPKTLTEMPLDPWTGKPFCYRREGESYVLYGVGPDRTDDNGASLKPSARGDLVYSTAK
jgi:hypothetical protein